MQTKVCTECHKKYPATVEYFHCAKNGKYGLCSVCKGCRQKYQQEHQQHKQEYDKQYRKEHQEKIQEYRQQHKKQANERKRNRRKTIIGCLREKFWDIKKRCENPSCQAYENYGGRGIKCKFVNSDEFIKYVTKVLKVDPRGLQIDRINNDGHYEPDNIQFVSPKINANNRRKRRRK